MGRRIAKVPYWPPTAQNSDYESRDSSGFKHSLSVIRHNRAMRVVQIVCLAMLLTPGLIWAGISTHIRLRLGGKTTLHVGQIAVLRLSSDHPYSVTLKGDAVVSLKAAQSERTYSYRAVRAGTASLLVTPTDRKKGECIDCATRHCFLAVVP